jgi:stearoyl-CoA desaturase (delta-9 desaturase)
MLYGLLNFPFWGYVLTTLGLTHITIIAVTVYLHRCQAHRALTLHPAASHFFRFWLWLTTGMQTREWVAIHRKHHARCETAEDPHSPQVKGIWKVLLEGTELYRAEAKNKDTLARFGQGAPDDWIERHLYNRHTTGGIKLLLALNLLLLGVPGLTVWAIQMAWIPFFAAGVINGVGHYWGYRNFECPDAARNIVPWGLLIGGEELHNNHHTFITSAKLSVKWWEFDIGWCYIRLLQALKLAKVKRLPPRLVQQSDKSHIDLDTVTAILTNRFHVMARYSTEVVLPILREEKRKTGLAGKRALKRARVLLTRAEHLLDETSQQHLAAILDRHHLLALVHRYRLALQAIWSRTTASPKELLEALQNWRREAEATGIAVLRNFAAGLARISCHYHIK